MNGWRVTEPVGELGSMIVRADAPPMKVTNLTAKFATTETILAEAETIHKEVKEANLDRKDHKAIDALHGKLQKKYANFSTSFPVPLREFVQTHRYNKDVFAKYLKYYQDKTKNAPKTGSVFSSRREFLEVQAEYLIMYIKNSRPKYDMKKIRDLRSDTIHRLEKEDVEIQHIQEEVAAEIDRVNASTLKQKKDSLLTLVRANAKTPPAPAATSAPAAPAAPAPAAPAASAPAATSAPAAQK